MINLFLGTCWGCPLNKRIVDLTTLKRKELEKLPDLTKGTNSKDESKGWNSPKLKDKWLRDNFSPFDLKDLEVKKSGIYSFDKDGRYNLRQQFPDNKILHALGDLSKKNKILGDLKNMRKMAEDDILGYGYKTAGTVTGRFTTSKRCFPQLY